MGKKFNKTLDVLEKAYQLATSKETKKVAKAALKFARDSGLGEKALNYVNKKVSKNTKERPGLDHLRQTLYNISRDDLVTKRENKTLSEALLHFTRHSGLGKKAVNYVNKKIKKKTRGKPIHETIRDVAYKEAMNFVSETPDRREPGEHAAKALFDEIITTFAHSPNAKSPAVGRHSPTSASTTPRKR